jgi:hypothetical protein
VDEASVLVGHSAVTEQSAPDLLTQRSGFIFKGLNVLEECILVHFVSWTETATLFEDVWNPIANGAASNFRQMGTSRLGWF